MSRNTKARELAMQTLFLWDVQTEASAEMARQSMAAGGCDPATQARAMEMATAAWAMRETTDQWIERIAPQWPPRRQPAVDRGIIRLAVWELHAADTPPKVVIDEAIELAKSFSTEQSPAFINGVLDAVLKEIESGTAPPLPPVPMPPPNSAKPQDPA